MATWRPARETGAWQPAAYQRTVTDRLSDGDQRVVARAPDARTYDARCPPRRAAAYSAGMPGPIRTFASSASITPHSSHTTRAVTR